MKIGKILPGVVIGLLLGWAGGRWIIRPVILGEHTTEQAQTTKVVRRESGGIDRILRERGPLRFLETGEDYLRVRAEGLSSSVGSPERYIVMHAACLKELPLEEIISLLESGALSGAEEIFVAFDRWAELDPMGAYEAVHRLALSGSDLRYAKDAVFRSWAKKNPEGMLEHLEKLPNSARRDDDVRALIEQWKQVAPRQALQSFSRLALLQQAGARIQNLRVDLITAWLKQDEEAVHGWMKEVKDDGERKLLEEALTEARLDFKETSEAVEMILSQPDHKILQSRLQDYWAVWASKEPKRALEKLILLPEGHVIWHYSAGNIAQQAMTSGAFAGKDDEVLNWVKSISDGEQKRKILLGLVSGASVMDLELAGKLIAEIPESEERQQSVIYYSEFLTRKNPVKAGEWLSRLDPSESRDMAVFRFASTLVQEQPSISAQWADTIDDVGRLKQARSQIYARWVEDDSEAANAWKEGWE